MEVAGTMLTPPCASRNESLIFSYFQLYMTLMHLLIVIHLSRCERCLFKYIYVWHDGHTHKARCIEMKGMFLKLIKRFLENWFQRVVLGGQTSSREPMLVGVPQSSVLAPSFFLIYVNYLSKSLSSITKLFTGDTSTFSSAKIVNVSTHQLISDLEQNSNWVCHWKMSFNLDPKKQAQ